MILLNWNCSCILRSSAGDICKIHILLFRASVTFCFLFVHYDRGNHCVFCVHKTCALMLCIVYECLSAHLITLADKTKYMLKNIC